MGKPFSEVNLWVHSSYSETMAETTQILEWFLLPLHRTPSPFIPLYFVNVIVRMKVRLQTTGKNLLFIRVCLHAYVCECVHVCV